MWDIVQILFFISIYISIGYLIIRYIKKKIGEFNPYLQIGIKSILYALFWGIGIFATGGDPGFGFPAPNIVAIILLVIIGNIQGIISAIVILCFWWIIFLTTMFLKKLIKERKTKNKKNIDYLNIEND